MTEDALIAKLETFLDTKIDGINDTSRTHIQDTIQTEFSKALTMLGIEAKKPLEVQRDMQFVRSHRLDSEDTRKKFKGKAVSSIYTALLFFLGLGIFEYLKGKFGG